MSLRKIQERRIGTGEARAFQELSDLCEETGYEIAPGTTSSQLEEIVESVVLGMDLDEGLGGRIKAAFHKAFKRKPSTGSARPSAHKKPIMWKPGHSRSIAAR